MKKILFITALGLGMISATDAQADNNKGDFATEIGFTPFHDNGESFKLNEGLLKFRYFLTNKDALRLKVNFGVDNTTNKDYKLENTINELEHNISKSQAVESKSKYSKFEINLGYERHFKTDGRLDLYAGVEFGYGIDSYSEKQDGTVNIIDCTSSGKETGSTVATVNRKYTNQDATGNRSSHYFTGNVFTGLDFYVYKSLYIGAELGINLKSKKSPNSYYEDYGVASIRNSWREEIERQTETFSSKTGIKTITSTIDNKTTVTTTVSPATKNEQTNTNLKLYVEPVIRLGWKF